MWMAQQATLTVILTIISCKVHNDRTTRFLGMPKKILSARHSLNATRIKNPKAEAHRKPVSLRL